MAVDVDENYKAYHAYNTPKPIETLLYKRNNFQTTCV